jgi:hypothetical protein
VSSPQGALPSRCRTAGVDLAIDRTHTRRVFDHFGLAADQLTDSASKIADADLLARTDVDNLSDRGRLRRHRQESIDGVVDVIHVSGWRK